MAWSGRISLVAKLIAYTVRYLRADGVFARISEIHCPDDAEALRQAATEMRGDYTALEIVCDGRLVWRGLREEAIAAAQS
jgi:hypothetical protein